MRAANVSRFAGPTEIVHGPGSVARLADEVRRLGGARVIVVTDEGLRRAGLVERVTAVLERAGVPFGVHDQVPVDPTFSDVAKVVADLNALDADTVVSLGSGSVLAAGRSAAVLARGEAASANDPTFSPLLSVCIPTTAGSGGEVSRQATLTEDGSQRKSGVNGWHVAARLAILDAELLVSVPRGQAVASGIDALVHAMEAYVSRRATPLTDALALPSFRTIFRDLPASLDADPGEGRDVAVLDRLLLASTMANLACGNAGLGLVHGLNKGITYLLHTGRYQPLPYGLLHAALLPWVMAFNLEAAPSRYADLAELMGVARSASSDVEVAGDGVERMSEWLERLGAPRRLPWPGCPDDDMALIVNDVLGRQMARDNPRDATAEELAAIVRRSISGW
jgi:alcohol dehydrogenase class IV